MCEMRFVIKDEIGNYVNAESIKRVNKDYYYLSSKAQSAGYINRKYAEKALQNLNKLNDAGSLGHNFTIHFEQWIESAPLVIKDKKTGLYVDERAFWLIPADDGTGYEWIYSSYENHINYILLYPTVEHAERIIKGLSMIAKLAAMDVEFICEELNDDSCYIPNGVHIHKTISKGTKAKTYKQLMDIRKVYIQ